MTGGDLNRSSVELEGTVRIEYDANSNPIYLGEAGVGVATSEAKWRIRKLTYDANSNLLSITWANGNTKYTNVWDDRAILTYS